MYFSAVFLVPALLLGSVLPVASAKEIVATHEWQRIGPLDTLPAGLEVRMDLSTGEKWARLAPPSSQNKMEDPHYHERRCVRSCQERQKERRRALLRAGRKDNGSGYQSNEQGTGYRIFDNIFPTLFLFAGVVFLISVFSRYLRNGFRKKKGGSYLAV